ncbi:Probable transposable element [Penicillium roqueforti FM164]|uniref:Probable transposable element n=1 Tax=Penicillium roqueforti (strain FM164) TaxID=1365484 RepID=W6Q9T9_PENRF|nr:Probable transposable element [Penicillium roqueforti FM164]
MAPAALQRVSALFCTHKSSVQMLEMNPWVISMDCTYKTIRYGLPLLDKSTT